MATVKKTVVKKTIKKAQFGDYFSSSDTTKSKAIGSGINTDMPRPMMASSIATAKAQTASDNEKAAYNKAKSPSSNPGMMKKGGKVMLKRKDGSTSQRGLWDNLRSKAAQNKKTGAKPKAPTKAMLSQEKKIRLQSKKKK